MWDCLAKLPKREHVAAAAEHEHWSNTFFLKQTTAGGTGTIATTKHPVLQKAKDWRREHVRFSMSSERKTRQLTQTALDRDAAWETVRVMLNEHSTM